MVETTLDTAFPESKDIENVRLKPMIGPLPFDQAFPPILHLLKLLANEDDESRKIISAKLMPPDMWVL